MQVDSEVNLRCDNEDSSDILHLQEFLQATKASKLTRNYHPASGPTAEAQKCPGCVRPCVYNSLRTGGKVGGTGDSFKIPLLA